MPSFPKVLPINGDVRPVAALKRHHLQDQGVIHGARETAIGLQQSVEKGDSYDYRRGHEPRDDE